MGINLEEARRPALVERAGVRLGFLSYTSVFWPVGHAAGRDAPGVATIKATTAYQPGPRALEMPGAPPVIVTTPDPSELEAMEMDVKNLRNRVDIVVVSCHWGVSGSNQVLDYQHAIGRAAISAGADIVIGHHPHVVQGIELWQGRPIFYSLGNFVFDWDRMRGNIWTVCSCVVAFPTAGWQVFRLCPPAAIAVTPLNCLIPLELKDAGS